MYTLERIGLHHQQRITSGLKTAGMDSTRQNKFSKLILKEIADIFGREGKNFYGSSFVTVTDVKVSPDLSIARIYLSLFQEKRPAEVIETITQHSREIRKILGNRIRNQVRIVPELHFYLDDTADYAEKMDLIMKNLVIPPADPAEQEPEK